VFGPRALQKWLCLADARQVLDLPKSLFTSLTVYDRGSETLGKTGANDGKSETCRASERQSHSGEWTDLIILLRRHQVQIPSGPFNHQRFRIAFVILTPELPVIHE